MDDSRIIELFFARSEQAIAELSRKYGPLCRRVAENLLNDGRDAEECVNDAYLAVWNTVPPVRPEPLASYVCRIVRNLALKKYRANTARKRNSAYDAALDELAECFPSAATPEEEAEAAAVAGIVNDFLETLDPRSRILFVRRCWHGDPIDELAGLFRMSRHAISVRLSRIRKALRKRLEEEGVYL